MSEKIKTAVMEVIKAHMDGEDKNTKAVLSDILESVNELETFKQEPCDKCEVGNPCLYCEHEFSQKIEPCDEKRDCSTCKYEEYPYNYQPCRDCGTLLESYTKWEQKERELPSVTQKSETVTEFSEEQTE